MVTLPPPQPEPSPHLHREIAESFGSDADRYDRARPRYPRALADAVLAGLPGGRVLDVGIGTGLSALPFREAGADVVGVEADARMAGVARSRGFAVEVARFEDWDAGAARFDAVVAGQTWHWIDPAGGAAKAAGLLRPGGRIALFWNAGDPAPEIAAAFGEVYRRVDTGLPFTPWAGGLSAVEGYEQGILARAADGIRETGAFTEPRRLRLDWQATVTREAWLDQVPTAGGHHRIPADRLATLLDGLGNVIDDHGGSFTMNYATIAVVADRRTPA
ncbi:class I SAM-dependent methyltransferase [Jiangella rhizosphaerae]|uniref:Class I SAM-dependent methyltransferase n=1 Tax=Jiangella rhizosphaerae TaxID=2293569 RepID=A0A418KMD8_9ACTN|nr:class I SAM-dependent methyltransferase [Jiangella rhizosphaerae]RIQ19574.1 class I SAM-dependent methyltransferase [Jiangella rhizosphaerae]